MLSIQEIVDDTHHILHLTWLAGQSVGTRVLSQTTVSASDLVGHLNVIHPARIQVFGQEEIIFFNRMSPSQRKTALIELAQGGVPCIIVAGEHETPSDLLSFCTLSKIPLLSTKVDAAHLIDALRVFLGRHYAPKTTVHGVFLDVLGLGVLITGESGLGKSELALELISRGHGLVADDAVEFSRPHPNLIEGKCPELLQNIIEVRGIGLLNIKTIFGETSVRRKMSLKLIVHLVRPHSEPIDRLALQEETVDILGLPIRRVSLQVVAGRNLAVLVEAAVRNTVLKIRGIDTLREFMERQSQAIRDSQP